jgi:hypothetical protein
MAFLRGNTFILDEDLSCQPVWNALESQVLNADEGHDKGKLPVRGDDEHFQTAAQHSWPPGSNPSSFPCRSRTAIGHRKKSMHTRSDTPRASSAAALKRPPITVPSLWHEVGKGPKNSHTQHLGCNKRIEGRRREIDRVQPKLAGGNGNSQRVKPSRRRGAFTAAENPTEFKSLYNHGGSISQEYQIDYDFIVGPEISGERRKVRKMLKKLDLGSLTARRKLLNLLNEPALPEGIAMGN